MEDGASTLWFLKDITSQHVIRAPLKLRRDLLAVADQGWGEAIVSQGAHSVRRIVSGRLRVVSRAAPTIVLLLGVTVLAPFLSGLV